MTSKNTHRIAIVGLVACFAASPAHATSQPLYEIVPASGCEPLADHHKVELFEGSWRFQGNETGLVSFYCPIRSSHFYVSPSIVIYENEAQAAFMDFYDIDESGPTYYVEAQLERSMETWIGASPVGDPIDTATDFGYNTQNVCLNGAGCNPLHAIERAKYHIRVDMYRGSTSSSPRLTAVGLTNSPEG